MAAMSSPDEQQPQPAPAPEPPAQADAGPPAPARSWRSFVPRRRQAPTPAAAEPAPDGDRPQEQPTAVIPPPPRPEGPSRLRRERRRLLTTREQAVYHLGGLAFELYRRDLLTEEVMRRRAGEVAMLDDTVRDIDARLGEIDRERRDRRRRRGAAETAVGNCLTCRAPFRAEARFCWQCGTQLVPTAQGDEQVTAVIAPVPEPPPERDAP
jgi:hypothetical protein